MEPTEHDILKRLRGDNQHFYARVPRRLAALFRARAAAMATSGNRLVELSMIATLRLSDVDLHARLATHDRNLVKLLDESP